MTNGPRVARLTLMMSKRTKGRDEIYDESATTEAAFDFFLALPLASRPAVRLAWNVSSGELAVF